jgi:hypothetical protein
MTLKLRVKIVELEPMFFRGKKTKKVKDGHCKKCGSKLTDELSIRRGYGRECFEKVTAIVLETYEATP